MKVEMQVTIGTAWAGDVVLRVICDLEEAHSLNTPELSELMAYSLSSMFNKVREVDTSGHVAKGTPGARERERYEAMAGRNDDLEDHDNPNRQVIRDRTVTLPKCPNDHGDMLLYHEEVNGEPVEYYECPTCGHRVDVDEDG